MDIVCYFLFLYPSSVSMPTCSNSALSYATSIMNHVFSGIVVNGEIGVYISFVFLTFPSCFLLLLHAHIYKLCFLILIHLLLSPQKQWHSAAATSSATQLFLSPVLETCKSWPVFSILAFCFELSVCTDGFICVLSQTPLLLYSF